MDTYDKHCTINMFWNNEKLIFVVIALVVRYGACETYFMNDYCQRELSFISKFVNQMKLTLNDDYMYVGSYSCETTIEAWYSTYPKLMFYFEDLDLDCDKGHLEFFSGSSGETRVSGLDGDICGKIKPQDVFAVDSRYLRIRYVSKQSQWISGIFNIIITAYAEDPCPSYAYECHNSRCIDQDVRCNGFDSCGDGSGCDLDTGVIIGIVIGSVAGLALIISAVICCFCCVRKSGLRPGTVQNPVSTTMTYTSSPQGYGQAVYGVNPAIYTVDQGSSPYPTDQAPYPAGGVAAGQQSVYSSQNYRSPPSYSELSTQRT